MAVREVTAPALWARTDIRSRWRSLVALALLAGITAGVALAALAGARRTDAALDRLREETVASDAVVFASQVQVAHPDWRKLEARPEVEEVAPWGLIFGQLGDEAGEVIFAPMDGRWGGDVNRSVVTEGRMWDPSSVDEAVVDEEAARQEDVHVGDVIRTTEDTPIARLVAVEFEDGTDVEAATTRLGEALGDRVGAVGTAEVPPELTNLRNVRTLPVVLAVFLAVLAVAALTHVLLTSARRRRRDFAVLRALGLTRRGGRVVLNSQGTAIGIVGLLVGVPLGIAAGRTGWDWVAESVPLQAVPPFAAVAVLLLVPVALVVANAVAVWPGRRVARLRPAQVLRSE